MFLNIRAGDSESDNQFLPVDRHHETTGTAFLFRHH